MLSACDEKVVGHIHGTAKGYKHCWNGLQNVGNMVKGWSVREEEKCGQRWIQAWVNGNESVLCPRNLRTIEIGNDWKRNDFNWTNREPIVRNSCGLDKHTNHGIGRSLKMVVPVTNYENLVLTGWILLLLIWTQLYFQQLRFSFLHEFYLIWISTALNNSNLDLRRTNFNPYFKQF